MKSRKTVILNVAATWKLLLCPLPGWQFKLELSWLNLNIGWPSGITDALVTLPWLFLNPPRGSEVGTLLQAQPWAIVKKWLSLLHKMLILREITGIITTHLVTITSYHRLPSVTGYTIHRLATLSRSQPWVVAVSRLSEPLPSSNWIIERS
jgi:hypothetical protein